MPIPSSKLRVCATYLREARNKSALKNLRILMLEHMLPTTEALVYLLAEAGTSIDLIYAKPYSIDREVVQRLSDQGFRVAEHSYLELESSTILDEALREAVAACILDGRKLAILDVGGYFAEPLSRFPKRKYEWIAGVVEDTTFGHNRYVRARARIHAPVISVARSRLKEIEAMFVGRDAVQATDQALRSVGDSITGRHALVVGYGMIGKNVARSLKAADLNVSVHDIRDHRMLKAFMNGFGVNKKSALLRAADIVFAATGWEAHPLARGPAVSRDEIVEYVRDNAVLASVGSKDNEFDIGAIRELAESSELVGEHLVRYALPNRRVVHVVREGTAVNFILPSIPVEVLDLVFSEIVLSVVLLLKNPNAYSPRAVHELREEYWSQIAKDWLRYTNVR